MQPFRSVLVPLDGSPFAEQALPFATALAARAGAILQVAMVHGPLSGLVAAIDIPQIQIELELERRREEQSYLDGVTTRLEVGNAFPVTSVLLDGAVAATLAEQVVSSAADLVVMTTHGRGPMSRLWLGSVADYLVRHLSVPILLIRPSAERPVRAPTIHKILVPLDGTGFAERVLDPALEIGRLMGAEYTLLAVVEPPPPAVEPGLPLTFPIDGDFEERLRAVAEGFLTRVATGLGAKGHRVSTQVLSALSAAQGVLDTAASGGFDLIAIATHGAGGMRRLILGSVADKVIRAGSLPVLVLHPETTQSAG
jgi:nucleotide-binding universal stress UspA family protein